MGTYLSPGVPEGLWGISHLRGSLGPISPFGSLWRDMYSLRGPWEHVSPLPRLSGEPVFLPGFLGALKACQSWAISLPREGGYL